MAIFQSPGVNVSEVDLTTTVPGVSTAVGGFAGHFAWGPANQVTTVISEVDLVNKFGKPNTSNYQDFFSAANFLSYANNLSVVRVCGSTGPAKNACAGATSALIQNLADYQSKTLPISNAGSWIAKYPGVLGNAISVYTLDSGNFYAATGPIAGGTVGINSYFGYSGASGAFAPSTSNFALSKGATGALDEVHVLVVDGTGAITGTAGTVLEKYKGLSKFSDALGDSGNTSYYVNVINNNSPYIWFNNVPGATGSGTVAWGTASNAFTNTAVFKQMANTEGKDSLTGAVDDYSTSVVAAGTGYNLFAADTVPADLVIAGAAAPSVVNSIAAITTARKDNVLFFSPQQSSVVNNAGNETTSVIADYASANLGTTSYAFMDSGWKYQYDKYSDVFRWVPLNGDIAGLCARTDQTRDPWYSPAGYNRGGIKNLVKLAWNPAQANRDALYQSNVNPVITQPGVGTVLFGDKTTLAKPSAFDRINVRRLFIVLEKSISQASKFSLFELNNASTRTQFVNLVEPFLRTVKGRNGITDYKVVCDTTNNTPQVIDANQFVGDIYVKPARSINYIQLNFIATPTGVDFNTVVGQF